MNIIEKTVWIMLILMIFMLLVILLDIDNKVTSINNLIKNSTPSKFEKHTRVYYRNGREVARLVTQNQ